MTSVELSAREIAERGEAIYRDILWGKPKTENIGKHIAFALEGGDHETDSDIVQLLQNGLKNALLQKTVFMEISGRGKVENMGSFSSQFPRP